MPVHAVQVPRPRLRPEVLWRGLDMSEHNGGEIRKRISDMTSATTRPERLGSGKCHALSLLDTSCH